MVVQEISVYEKKTDLPPKEVLDWARRFGEVARCERVTHHAWAETFRLLPEKGGAAYLKILPWANPGATKAIALLAENFAPDVPEIIASAPEQGVFLMLDHGGEPLGNRYNRQSRLEVMKVYARIQERASAEDAILAELPRVYCPGQYDMFEKLLSDAAEGRVSAGQEGNPFLHFAHDRLKGYAQIFAAARGVLREFLSLGDELPQTVNHGDLRAANIAQRSDGSMCIFDWDDIAKGPPGLSLHSAFGGCSPVFAACNGTGTEADREALETYVATLGQSGQFEAADLWRSLPSAACAGLFRFIVSFARFPSDDPKSNKAVATNVRRRLSDLLDLLTMLPMADGDQRDALAEAFENSGRVERAALLRRTNVRAKPKKRHIDDAFPQIKIPKSSIKSGKIANHTRDEAVEIFRRDGALLIPNAIPVDTVENCARNFAELRDAHSKTIQEGGALRVGDKRFMISLELTEPFSDAALLASPIVLPVLQKLLSEQLILGSLTAVASQPGAAEQRLHRDNPALFGEARELLLPSFSIAMIVPLVPLNGETGATRVMKGSHLLTNTEAKGQPLQEPDQVPLGSCYLMDSRLFHQGMANQSDITRPILSIVYQRPWYRDPENFKRQQPLIFANSGLSGLDPAVRKLTEWAIGTGDTQH